MAYLTRLWSATFARLLIRTDVFAAVVAALLPAAYFIAGRPMPEDPGLAVSLIVACAMGVFLIVRLATAPYRMWIEDQSEINRLQEVIERPERRDRQRLLDFIADDRYFLVRELQLIIGDVRTINKIARDPIETIERLRPAAGLMLGDRLFKVYWFTLEKNMKGYNSLKLYGATDDPMDHSSEARKELTRFSFHTTLIMGASEALVHLLTGRADHAQVFARFTSPQDGFEGWDIDFSFAIPTQQYFHELPWPGRGMNNPQDWIGP